MVEYSFTNYVVVGSNPVTVTWKLLTLGKMQVPRREYFTVIDFKIAVILFHLPPLQHSNIRSLFKQ